MFKVPQVKSDHRAPKGHRESPESQVQLAQPVHLVRRERRVHKGHKGVQGLLV